MARGKKKIPSSNLEQSISLNKKQLNALVRGREEDLMFDDHGEVVIGRRDQKPKHPDKLE